MAYRRYAELVVRRALMPGSPRWAKARHPTGLSLADHRCRCLPCTRSKQGEQSEQYRDPSAHVKVRSVSNEFSMSDAERPRSVPIPSLVAAVGVRRRPVS